MALTELSNVQKAKVVALVEARRLDVVIDKPPADKAAQQFDRLRRARNQDRYQAKPVGAAAADQAEQVARDLFETSRARVGTVTFGNQVGLL